MGKNSQSLSAALEAWVALEAEPAVVSYCERPLIIPDSRPKRVVDFWVHFGDREELWLLEREHGRSGDDGPQQIMPELTSWGLANGMAVRFVPPVRDDKSVYLDNWGRIIWELSANRRFVSRALLGRVQPLSHLFAVVLSVARFVFFGLFMAILVKRLSRR